MIIYDPAEWYLHGSVLEQKDYFIFCTVIMNLPLNMGKGADNLSTAPDGKFVGHIGEEGDYAEIWHETSVQFNITYLYYNPIITKRERWTVLL